MAIKEKGANIFFEDLKDVFIKDWKFISIAFFLSLVLHFSLWKAYPYHLGPDGKIFLYYFIDFFNEEPLFPMILTYRTPIVPFFYGALIKYGGVVLLTIISELLAIILIPVIYMIAVPWGKLASRVSTIFFIFLLPFQIQFHQISSDALFGWSVLILLLVFRYAIENPDLKNWIILGVFSALAILVRPSGIILLVLFLAVVTLRINWKRKLKLIGVYALMIFILLGSFVLYKGIRFEDYSISRGSKYIEFNRIYSIQDTPIIQDMGPHSKRFIEMIEENILTKEFYKNYSIDIDKFLNYKPNKRFFGDIIVMIDRIEGWDTDYGFLRKVALESVKSDPVYYFKNIFLDIVRICIIPQGLQQTPNFNSDDTYYIEPPGERIEQELFEGELIPHSETWWMLSRPDSTMPSSEEFSGFNEELKELFNGDINLSGSDRLVRVFYEIWDNTSIPILFFWVFGLIGIIVNKGRRRIILLGLFLIPLLIIVGTVYGMPVYERYRLPLEPLIVISGIVGFLSLLRKVKPDQNP